MAEWNDNDWIRQELTRELAPVKAPESLWGRVEAARRMNRRASGQAGWILWPAVAMMMLMASGDLVWEMGKERAATAHLTRQVLTTVADGSVCDVRGPHPSEIAHRVKEKANTVSGLSCGSAGNPHLMAATLTPKHMASISAVAWSGPISWMGVRDNQAACSQCHVDSRSQL